jgi:hypothetical protein
MEILRNSIKYIFLFIVYIIFIVGFIYYCNNKNREAYDDILLKKIKLFNWWNMESNEDMILFLRRFFSYDTMEKYREIQFYSVFGEVKFNREPDILYVQYSGESFYVDTKRFDINLIHHENPEEDSNIIVFPYGFFHILCSQMNMNYFLEKRVLHLCTFETPLNGQASSVKRVTDCAFEMRNGINVKKEKFCLFSVNNGSCHVRNIFFEKLSKYKKVDSCGGFMNNMDNGEKCPFEHDKYYQWISQYKFMICFENKSMKNYLTEKLFNAYYGGAIPIYWGCPNVNDYVNMNSILYLKNDYTDYEMDNLINEIVRLDTDDAAYKERYDYELFREGKLPDTFNYEKIKDKIEEIVD